MIQKTPARSKFKQHLGQANHYLVTSIVALKHLDESDLISAPEELRTSWNPKDKHRSIERTRTFVSQSFLGWAVDSIDLYLSLLNRKPKFIRDEQLVKELEGAGRSVYLKSECVGRHYGVKDSTRALVSVLITWRNNVMHELADNEVDNRSRQILLENATQIEERYRHLQVHNLADKAEAGESLTFKETASLISASHNFVESVDNALLVTFDQKAFCVEAVTERLAQREDGGRFAQKYFSLSGAQRRRFTNNWLVNTLGFESIEADALDACSDLLRPVSSREDR